MSEANTETELRIYRVKDGRLDDFVDAWRTQVVPFREELGFRILGAWHSVDRSEFAWQLSHSAAESMEAVEQRYAEARAEREFDPDPADFLDGVEVRFLRDIAS